MASQTGLSKEAKEAKAALIEAGAVPQSIRSLIRKGDATVVDPRIISYPSVPGRMTWHQTNGTKLQECLYFKKSRLPKMEEMHPPLLPLKPVEKVVVDLEEDPVDPVNLVVEMTEDLMEGDPEDPAAAAAAAGSSSGSSSLFCQMAYSSCLLNGKVLPRAVLLDNQSTTHVFCN